MKIMRVHYIVGSIWVFLLLGALAVGCGPAGGRSGNCPEQCAQDRTACETCCNMTPDFMRNDCLTTCSCSNTCCIEDCGGGQPGDCSQCRVGDPYVLCDLELATDDDGDGYSEYENDCDDTSPFLNPGRPETPGDGIDNDCNGITDADFDSDGHAAPADCDDNNPNIHPDMPEICINEIDENCNGETDEGCPTPCEMAATNRSSVGCVYYGIDTNPMRQMVGGDYAVVVSNIDDTLTANVVIELKSGGVWNAVPNGNFSVSPLSLQTTILPLNAQDGSLIVQNQAYRITSDLPVVAYQFNPLDGSMSYLSDASLLLPASAFDTVYLVPAWPYAQADQSPSSGWPAHIQVVASAPTQVRVTSPIPTTGEGITPLSPGVMSTFDLEEGDVLQLTVLNFLDSFAGTYVESDQPVAVFSSNDCANVPANTNPPMCCCEHLEEQVFGLQTWGKEYVAARVPMRQAEPAIWQIMAHLDNTVIQFNYQQDVTGLPPSVTLNAGEYVEYEVGGSASNPGDFLISANNPILVTQFMVAAFMVQDGGSDGDPAMAQAVPSEQFLEQYVVLVPDTWINDYLVLIRRVGSTVSVDDVPVDSGWVPVGSSIDPSMWEVNRFPVTDGVHVLTGTAAFGVIVMGYDSYDSYAYPGGLDQQIINPVE